MDYEERRIHTHTHIHTQDVFFMVSQALKFLRDVPEDTGFLSYKDAMIREMKKQASCVCVCAGARACIPHNMYIVLLHYDAWLNCHYVIK